MNVYVIEKQLQNVYRCEQCDEIIEYEMIKFFDVNFCSDDCLDEYVKEHRRIVDIDR